MQTQNELRVFWTDRNEYIVQYGKLVGHGKLPWKAAVEVGMPLPIIDYLYEEYRGDKLERLKEQCSP